jgi:hypothetical protein
MQDELRTAVKESKDPTGAPRVVNLSNGWRVKTFGVRNYPVPAAMPHGSTSTS